MKFRIKIISAYVLNFCTILLLHNICYSQQSNYPIYSTWEKLFPVTIPIDETGQDICQTTDGNYVMVGYAEDNNYRVIKINTEGDTLWTKKYKTAGSVSTKACCCYSIDNGCFLVSGEAVISGNNYSFLTKLDAYGDIVWDKNYSEYGLTYYAREIQETFDGGYIIQAEDFVLKIDSIGNYQWSKKKTDFNAWIIYSFEKGFNDNCYYCLVLNFSIGSTIIKLNNEGNLLWQKAISRPFYFCRIRKINGKFVIFGVGNNISNEMTYSIIKMDSSGNFFNIDSLQTFRRENININTISVINNSRMIFATNTVPGGNMNHCYLRVIDTNFNIIKSQTITSNNGGYKTLKSLRVLSDNMIIGAGYGSLVYVGGTEQFYGIRTDTNLFIHSVGIKKEEYNNTNSFYLYQNFPNPFNNETKIKYQVTLHGETSNNKKYVSLKIYDILGKEIATLINKKQDTGEYEVIFNGVNLASGIYFAVLKVDSKVKVHRLVLQK